MRDAITVPFCRINRHVDHTLANIAEQPHVLRIFNTLLIRELASTLSLCPILPYRYVLDKDEAMPGEKKQLRRCWVGACFAVTVSYAVNMKQIPNLITSVRLLAAIVLISLSLTDSNMASSAFLTLFCLAGFSDMLDGFIARHFNWCTEFGARLDSISDLVFYLSVVIFLTLHATAYFAPSFPLLAIGLAVQLFHWVLAQTKHGAYPAYHSTFSRVCAYAMFFTMLAFWSLKFPYLLGAMVLAWIACSFEGIAITLILEKCATNVSSIQSALALRKNSSRKHGLIPN